MSDKTSKSHLSLRIPSNESDEKFISGISSVYEAAKLRSDQKTHHWINIILQFSWKEFSWFMKICRQ